MEGVEVFASADIFSDNYSRKKNFNIRFSNTNFENFRFTVKWLNFFLFSPSSVEINR